MKIEWMRRISARDNTPTVFQRLEHIGAFEFLLNLSGLVPEES